MPFRRPLSEVRYARDDVYCGRVPAILQAVLVHGPGCDFDYSQDSLERFVVPSTGVCNAHLSSKITSKPQPNTPRWHRKPPTNQGNENNTCSHSPISPLSLWLWKRTGRSRRFRRCRLVLKWSTKRGRVCAVNTSALHYNWQHNSTAKLQSLTDTLNYVLFLGN